MRISSSGLSFTKNPQKQFILFYNPSCSHKVSPQPKTNWVYDLTSSYRKTPTLKPFIVQTHLESPSTAANSPRLILDLKGFAEQRVRKKKKIFEKHQTEVNSILKSVQTRAQTARDSVCTSAFREIRSTLQAVQVLRENLVETSPSSKFVKPKVLAKHKSYKQMWESPFLLRHNA